MKATSVPPARASNSRFLFRIVVAVLVLILAVFLLFDWWFYHAVRAALPQVDGRLRLSGLAAPVIVSRDSLGMPHITAQNLADLFYAQGYVTAQDRLWQMDMTRRFASGDLAAVLGPKYVKSDVAQRTLGLTQVAQHVVADMDPQQRAYFDAYAAGVNAYIQQHQKTLPVEFRFMVYFPYAWTPEDSVLVGLSMSEFLNHGIYRDELEKEKVLARLGPELTADLFVNSSWRDHPPGSENVNMENEAPSQPTPENEDQAKAPRKSPTKIPRRTQAQQERRRLRSRRALMEPSIPASSSLAFADEGMLEERLRPGSNNWVLSGTHTMSGKPLLSNDMHLDLRIPNTWYEAQLTAGDFDVTGVTLPGVPFVIVGHNRRLAWGFTNLGPTVEDLYVEKFNDQGQYLTPQGWQPPEHRKEIIRVKGKHDVELDVVVTRHGPIITSLVPGETRKLALKWVIYDSKADRIPFFAVDAAKNWAEFRAAFSQLGAPGQNVVYADVDGNIGYQATGMIPIRAASDGSVPVPGEDDAHEWIGYVPYDKLPSVYNPPSGVLATANSRITPDGYPYTLSFEWTAPYRTERIYQLLNADKKFTPDDMLAIQTDVHSEIDLFCAQRLVYAVDHTPNASPRAKQAADLMRTWDGSMDADSVAATLANYSRHHLEELLLKAKLGDEWKEYRWFMKPVWLEGVLSHEPERWLPPGFSSYNQLLTSALEATVNESDAPGALSTWKWGKVHRVDITHPFWSHFPILKRVAGPGPQPLSGNGDTVKQVGTHFGPSERFTADLSNFDNSILNIVNGESGSIFDEHYNDQWDAYYHGRSFPLPFSPQAVENSAKHHLRLEPQ